MTYDATLVTLEDMYQAITELGYSPGLQPAGDTGSDAADEPLSSPILPALAQALREDKLVLVDFSAAWCIACKALETVTLSDASVVDALESYVFLVVDTDTFADVASSYNVIGMPTLVVLNGAGEELFRNVGLITPAELSRELERLAAE